MNRALLPLCTMLLLAALASTARAKGLESKATNASRAGKAASAPKTTGARAARSSGRATPAKQVKAKRACLARPVQLVRVRGEQVEPHELSLTRCDGTPNVAALEELSIVARPRDVDRPNAGALRAYRALPIAKGKVPKGAKKKFRDPAFVSERVRRLDKGLLVRLQRVANRYPGRIIEVISGYRPDARFTSRHHHGRALDLRVAGVAREQLVSYLRQLDDTGVGYYPNSYFVHMDVREQKGFWVDRSGPGEKADYGPWPRPKQELDHEREQVVKSALAALVELDRPLFRTGEEHREPTAKLAAPAKRRAREQPEHEADDMSPGELERVRAEARRAIERL